jgi:hypothetical protein
MPFLKTRESQDLLVVARKHVNEGRLAVPSLASHLHPRALAASTLYGRSSKTAAHVPESPFQSTYHNVEVIALPLGMLLASQLHRGGPAVRHQEWVE